MCASYVPAAASIANLFIIMCIYSFSSLLQSSYNTPGALLAPLQRRRPCRILHVWKPLAPSLDFPALGVCCVFVHVHAFVGSLVEQLVHRRVRLGILLQHLGDRHLEIFLADVLSSFPQRIHPCLGANTTYFSSGTLTHLFSQRSEIDTTLQGHFARMDTKDRDSCVRVGRREFDFAVDTSRA